MFRPQFRGRRLCLISLLTPLLLWATILLVTPTGWVRSRLIARLEAETGRAVGIDSVHLNWSGNLRIANLSFAEVRNPRDPWLRIADTSIDVHLGQVLLGCCTPGDVVASGVSVRVWRRGDGRFEFGDLATSCPIAGAAHVIATRSIDLFPSFNFRLSDASVQLIDDGNDLRCNLTNITASGSYRSLAVKVDDLRGMVNGGRLTMAGQLIRDPVLPRFSAEFRADRVHLDQGLNLIGTLIPLVAQTNHALGGMLNFGLSLKGQGASSGAIQSSLVGHGSVLLDPIDLDGSRILSELRVLGEWPKENHVGAVSSNFTVANGRVATEDLTIRSTKIPFVVAGWTDFTGRFDYETRVDQMIASLPREARSILGELKINLDELTGLRIAGSKDQVELTLRGRPLADKPGQPPNTERTKIRETARKLRDRIFR